MVDSTVFELILLVGAVVWVCTYVSIKRKERKAKRAQEAKERIMAGTGKWWTARDDGHATEL